MNLKDLRNISQIKRILSDILQLSLDKIMMRLLNSTIFKVRVASQIHQTQISHILITVKMKMQFGLSKELFTIKRSLRTPGFQVKLPLSKIHLHHGGVRNL